MSEEEDSERMQLCPSVFGLKRVEEVAKLQAERQQQRPEFVPLNRRGLPARVRKKNPFIYNEQTYNPGDGPGRKLATEQTVQKPIIIAPKTKPRTSTPAKRKEISPRKNKPIEIKYDTEKVIHQMLGVRLRNFLRLTKAQRWVCSEWFYSDIDRALFLENNDFTICLKETFPQLKCQSLTRIEWTIIRRLMGKPRRCSQNFFAEEIRELETRRRNMRALQQRQIDDGSYKEMPETIPMPAAVGAAVTAWVHSPKKGLFTGVVEEVDVANGSYVVRFDKAGLDTLTIPDYEVMSNVPPETISKSSILNELRPPVPSPPRPPPMVPDSPRYPVALLETMVRLQMILLAKKAHVQSLRELNTQTERMALYGQSIDDEFRTRYAGNIVTLEMIDRDLSDTIGMLNRNLRQLDSVEMETFSLTPELLQEETQVEAVSLVKRCNVMAVDPEKCVVEDESVLDLITELTSLMLQVKTLAEYDRKPYEVDVLKKTMVQIKLKLSPHNQRVFESCVEIHMQHIQDGLSGFTGLVAPNL